MCSLLSNSFSASSCTVWYFYILDVVVSCNVVISDCVMSASYLLVYMFGLFYCLVCVVVCCLLISVDVLHVFVFCIGVMLRFVMLQF